VTADKIAEVAEFFSFGTNDLTQTTLGMSRDDAGSFLGHYVDQKIFKRDPFESIDQEGVGEIMRIATEKGRSTRPDMEIGICGEHGGEAESVIFCHKIGLDYVSCSPYRVPVARMAGAHAVIREREAKKEEAAKEKARAKKAAQAANSAEKAQSAPRPRPLRFPPAAKKAQEESDKRKEVAAPARSAAKPTVKAVPAKPAAKAKAAAKPSAKPASKPAPKKAAKPAANKAIKPAAKKPAPKKGGKK